MSFFDRLIPQNTGSAGRATTGVGSANPMQNPNPVLYNSGPSPDMDQARRGLYGGFAGSIPGSTVGTSPVYPNNDNLGNTQNSVTVQGRQIIQNSFQAFGYTPSEEEVQALMAGFKDTGGNVNQLRSAVANYTMAVRRNQELNANDPTKQVMADERGFFNSTQARAAQMQAQAGGVQDQLQQNDLSKSRAVQNQYQQLQGTMSQAPKLFGNFTPDQINQYLNPLRTQFNQSNSLLQGQAARRGLAGSSTELNTLADAENQFKQNVLSQGLNIGMQEQAAGRDILSQGINVASTDRQLSDAILAARQSQLFGAGEQAYSYLPGSLGRQAGISGAQQAAATDQSNYMSQLPAYLSSISLAAGSQPVASPGAAPKSNNALAGALSGASTGAAFGPWGAAIGGGAGLLLGSVL